MGCRLGLYGDNVKKKKGSYCNNGVLNEAMEARL